MNTQALHGLLNFFEKAMGTPILQFPQIRIFRISLFLYSLMLRNFAKTLLLGIILGVHFLLPQFDPHN